EYAEKAFGVFTPKAVSASSASPAVRFCSFIPPRAAAIPRRLRRTDPAVFRRGGPLLRPLPERAPDRRRARAALAPAAAAAPDRPAPAPSRASAPALPPPDRRRAAAHRGAHTPADRRPASPPRAGARLLPRCA